MPTQPRAPDPFGAPVFESPLMAFTHFTLMTGLDPAQTLSPQRSAALRDMIAADPLPIRALLYRATAAGAYTRDAPDCDLILQLYFDSLPDLETASARGGLLHRIQEGFDWSGIAIAQQAMYVRPQPVPDPIYQREAGQSLCSYLVHYDGHAEDYDAWLAHYLGHHPGVIARFPRLREYEIYTCVDWTCGDLTWPKSLMMQRNRLIFDSGPVLGASLATEGIRSELGDRTGTWPKFHGTDVHVPMYTEILTPR